MLTWHFMYYNNIPHYATFFPSFVLFCVESVNIILQCQCMKQFTAPAECPRPRCRRAARTELRTVRRRHLPWRGCGRSPWWCGAGGRWSAPCSAGTSPWEQRVLWSYGQKYILDATASLELDILTSDTNNQAIKTNILVSIFNHSNFGQFLPWYKLSFTIIICV